MKEHLDIFNVALREATRVIEEHYFQLPVAGAEAPIFRERVYCYELYHQLRCALPRDFPYVLNGEVDKGGHPILRDDLGPLKPDFIVHMPHSEVQNLVVVEVKSVSMSPGDFLKDLNSLRAFLHGAHYYAAIALIYGAAPQTVLDRHFETFQNHFRDVPKEHRHLLWHPGPHTAVLDLG